MAFDPYSVFLAGAFVGLGLLVREIRSQRAQWGRVLRRHPSRRVVDARVGPLKIVGTARPIGQPLIAPLSGRACLGYTIVIRGGTDGDRVLTSESTCADFHLVDETGALLIHAAMATLVLRDDTAFVSGGMKRPEPAVEAYVGSRGIQSRDTFSNPPLHCQESILAVEAQVVVFGPCQQEIDPAPAQVADYRELPTRFVITGGESAMLVSDDETLVNLGRRRR